MDIQLNELITKIKHEGVKIAEDTAAHIISEAEQKASSIVQTAETKANEMKESAKKDVEKIKRDGTEALQQAGKTLLLAVRTQIENLFDKIIKVETAETLDKELMEQAIMAAIQNLISADIKNMQVQIPSEKFDAIESRLRNRLASELAKGMEIVPYHGLQSGFRISMKDGTVFYDFSDREIGDMLSLYLNPRLSKLLTDQE